MSVLPWALLAYLAMGFIVAWFAPDDIRPRVIVVGILCWPFVLIGIGGE